MTVVGRSMVQAVELTRHVYDADQFLNFLKCVDMARSKMGICNR